MSKASRVERLSMKIRPLLVGHGPDVQSAVLADLVSLWIAGHHPELRAKVLDGFVELIEQLVPESEKEIFGNAGFPMEGMH